VRKRLTARDIVHNFVPGDYSGDPDDQDMLGDFWKNRYQQSKWSPMVSGSGEKDSIYDSIEKEGQKKPVSLNLETKEILDGHHRIAAMYHMNPDQFVKYRSWKPS
jgi:hypothetical protein